MDACLSVGVVVALDWVSLPAPSPRIVAYNDDQAPTTAMSSSNLLNEFRSLVQETTKAQLHDGPAVSGIQPSDVLLVIDMQHDFLPGGAFGVAEGDAAVGPIVDMIHAFGAAGATVVATRDYHPRNHCSFSSHGGPFPSHCVQGTNGSFLVPPIADAMRPLLQPTSAAKGAVVFKGFSPSVDSFGGLPYNEAAAENRISKAASGPHCELSWTGSFVLFSSNMEADANAPPDVMAVLDRKPLGEWLVTATGPAQGGRIFVAGLALDFCVQDTALNAARLLKESPAASARFGGGVYVVVDATRAAHIPGVGASGSGFLQCPEACASKMLEAGVRWTTSDRLIKA